MKKIFGIVLAIALITGLIPTVNVTAAKKVSISKKNLKLTVGKKTTLQLKNAKKKKVKWSSSRKSVASVSKTGKITAKKRGTTKITAKYLGKKYFCKVTVKEKSTITPVKKPEVTPTKQPVITPTANPTAEPTESPTTINYLCDWAVQYDSQNSEHILVFGLRYTKNGERVSGSGNVQIDITNTNNEKVYSEKIAFSEKDFGSWSSISWNDSPRYLCSIHIPDSALAKTNYNSGQISFVVSTNDGAMFSVHTLDTSNLPVNEPTLTVSNSFPQTFSSYVGSRIGSTVTIKSGTYSFEKYSSGFHLKISLLATVEYLKQNWNNASVDYRLYNSNGIVVSSGTMNKMSLTVGDSFYFEGNIYGLDIDDYVLVIDDEK